ncbi:MAG: ABC transporter permease [Spirochaetaceae bacterium]|jgi:ABC-2 type transport system permease protein|nr:ABC transporter permease [Spirochaetaceae bacterium]
MSKFWIIALETYRKYTASVSFLVMTFTPVLGGAVFSLAMDGMVSLFGGVEEIAVVAEDEPLFTAFQAVVERRETRRFYWVPSSAAARTLLKEKDIKAYLILEKRDAVFYGRVYTNTALDVTDMQSALNILQRELAGSILRLTSAESALLNEPARFETVRLDFTGGNSGRETPGYSFERQTIVTLLVTVIFGFISMYAGIIAMEIASEKGTRVMEITLSSVTAETHFYAKLTGMGFLGLTGALFYVFAGLCAYPYLQNAPWIRELSSATFSEFFGGLFIVTAPITLFSAALYMIVAALSGSLASKAEEGALAVQPLIWLGIIGYLGAFIFSNDPDHIAMKLMSYTPFLSAFAMPMRLACNAAALWEILVSAGLLIITGAFLLIVSARIYASNALIYCGGGLLKALKQSLAGLQTARKDRRSGGGKQLQFRP